MKIALVGAIDSETGEDAIAGTEIWTYNFLLELSARGHEVVLFGSKDSKVEQPLVASVDSKDLIDSHTGEISGMRLAYFSIEQMLELIKRQNDFDLIHLSVYSLQYYLPLLKLLNKPVVITVHGSGLNKEDADKILPLVKQLNFVFISNSFLLNWGKPEKYEVVYNGIRIDDFPFNEEKEDYLFWMGRISPEKGLDDAVKIAVRTNSKLIIAGPNRHPEFFNQNIKPRLSDKIKYVGELGLDEKVKYYQRAKAFLMPIHWEEPFGLVLIEAMACGTPVIAYDRGSVPEIIEDGKNGYIVAENDIDGMIDAIKNIDKIDQKYCRESVINRFTIDKMVSNYERIYQKVTKHYQGSKGI